MKKSLNFLLILSVVCLALSLILCIASVSFGDDAIFFATNNVTESITNAGSDDPGAGWLALLLPFTVFTDIAGAIVIMFILVFIPLFVHFLIITFQGVARLFQIGETKDWKNTTSKVLTVFSIVFQIIVCIILILNLRFGMLLSGMFDGYLIIGEIFLLLAIVVNITNVVLFIREFIKMSNNNQVITQ